ncbi:uncharacterized protein LOC128669706 [Plodia interpunctella]|uniref:uncharacterized protein LOC128669706 n=1 Tax=Plodia interpunctella TaxID=58824 RepID=UPI0023687B85|nr:uncharacterized protein LOC128669706 [Plodia interpunctella]
MNQVNARISVFILQSFFISMFYMCRHTFHLLSSTPTDLVDCKKDAIDKPSKRNANSKNTSQIHQCIRVSMRMCRWVGWFPVEGLDKPTISGLRYNVKGFYGIYHLASLLIALVTAIFNVLYILSDLSLETIYAFSQEDLRGIKMKCISNTRVRSLVGYQQMTFIWSFFDILIICFSTYLTSYFQDLNTVINNRKNIPWERLRIHYLRLVDMVDQVNNFFLIGYLFVQVQRFRMQIKSNSVALSGILFPITRSMLLQIFASALTYEIIMLQFH